MTHSLMKLGYNDGVLLISLLYSSIDIQYEWDTFSTCKRPLHHWLLVSYVAIVCFRVTHILGMRSFASAGADSGGDFLLNLRQKGTFSKVLISFTWLIALPFFTLWTMVGTWWLYDTLMHTAQCLPMGTHLWFIIFWQILSYLWIFIHMALGSVAWLLERRVRRAESDLRSIEDDDVLNRWGQVSQLQGYMSLTSSSGMGLGGLTPAQIQSLPSTVADVTEASEATECPICLNDFQCGEKVRQLGSCGHTFHKSCIDLWLLRRADCPLCKRKVDVECNKCVEARSHISV
eukprot:gnl/TRDRNA2_/TRDRNA2_178538_c0_seq1.p1 gnl/TRDRNA2_/TRDRNA2_178538_c0~~gnl/TRDRNA2_/TRDRNA2_178538_c0_seq1.p1  ORF type:complete len:289 (+),score=38.12 gnl/TRDRNA2_/TRDRNA2_178538_c0_seq1:99-965(+)